ncbi:phosphatase PAP2 family protein [Chitinophaga sp. 30R24]|uniref:phosphatase PAP2 family protein n=1 Tax=Chitinophaga sp. 30R24 TaxID=3248838 RepID=UPI003B905C58
MKDFLQRFLKVSQQLTYFLWTSAILLIAVLTTRLFVSRTDAYFYINRLHTPFGDFFFSYVTELGSVSAAVLISLLLLIFKRRIGWALATAYLFTSAISFSLKVLVGFPRPHRYFFTRLHDIYFVPGITVLDNFRSFPSGHTVCAFTAATVLSYFARNKHWSWLYFALAALTGYSRMYLSQHFLEDVIAGMVLGVFFTMVWLTFITGKLGEESGL